ncbi:MAG: restriction endonuclease subunit S [Mesorhizobium sp.]|uniref:restriction endonuclease subunit S n=1 Tax=Mesorhizobium sp. TaxID=1871066 RepID=UPI000FE65FA3|nr:restriction endonuclease subunit S [Mesorhizobium sp.]RWN48991.1 MAG: restriction endonuclease subunit S [Mesorhizobium sp.]
MNGAEPRLGDYFVSRRERGKAGLPTLSVTLDRGLVRRDSLDRKTDTTLTDEEHLRVHPGDIAYNMMRMWQGASGLADEEALVSPAYIVLAPKNLVDPRFAAYLFKLPEMVHRFWAYSYGLTDDRLRLYFNDFKRIPRELPPVFDQRKIAEILSTWDAAIETTGKLLANAEAQKRSLMQHLLTGKRRLKGFEGREWKRKSLGDVLEITYGKSPKEIAADQGAYPILGTGGETGRSDDWLVEGPAIVIGRKGTIDKPMFVTGKFWPIDTTFFCKAKPGNNLFWAYYSVQRMRLRSFSEASGVPSLSRDTLRAIKVQLPDLDEQERIAEIVYLAELEADRVRSVLRILQMEKRALMQQLLTGKRKVRP